MVYVGAITILTVFAIMLTRHANQGKLRRHQSILR